ncbi:MAG TPA: hypothetical protein VNW06_05270 [Cytophagaceae bacterium]|jgi:hypothetical protein|nr:hypothetical protein [Cytophagaceae bacterium]
MVRKLIIVVVLIIAVGLGILSYFVFGTYSEGDSAGTLMKLSKKGVIFKTWEGDLNKYMYVGDQSAASASANLFTFSVMDNEKEVIATMEKAMLNGHRIKLSYKEKYYAFPWNGDTKYFIYKAEIVE